MGKRYWEMAEIEWQHTIEFKDKVIATYDEGMKRDVERIRKLRATNACMLEALKEAEWVDGAQRWGSPAMICPVCEVDQEQGHAGSCKLDTAIKAALNLN